MAQLTGVAVRRSRALDVAYKIVLAGGDLLQRAVQGNGDSQFVLLLRNIALIVGASLLVALCARIYLPLPGTPVPLTVQNFAVLLVGLTLGSRRGFAALALYLVEGAAGMPVFSPTGPGSLAQLVGPTGGYLLAYPVVAALAGYIFEHSKHTFARAALAALAGEVLLFASGISWLYVLTHSLARAISFGLYWFIFAEIMKVMFAAGSVKVLRDFFPRERSL